MEDDGHSGSENNTGAKRKRRREILEKKKAVCEIVKTASSSTEDPLCLLPSFRHYQKEGLYVYLLSGRGNKLSCYLKRYIQKLLKLNMEGVYASEWLSEEKVKHREMVDPEARYIFAYATSEGDAHCILQSLGRERKSLDDLYDECTVVGFVHYRFIVEEEIPVLYVYELQLETRVQGKGLGKFLMQLVEHIACKNSMSAVVLTVQKANSLAMDFYISKLRYSVSSTSPSRVTSLIAKDYKYEILCKTFNDEARTMLEEKGWMEEK